MLCQLTASATPASQLEREIDGSASDLGFGAKPCG